jgi:hypothetical protein
VLRHLEGRGVAKVEREEHLSTVRCRASQNQQKSLDVLFDEKRVTLCPACMSGSLAPTLARWTAVVVLVAWGKRGIRPDKERRATFHLRCSHC